MISIAGYAVNSENIYTVTAIDNVRNGSYIGYEMNPTGITPFAKSDDAHGGIISIAYQYEPGNSASCVANNKIRLETSYNSFATLCEVTYDFCNKKAFFTSNQPQTEMRYGRKIACNKLKVFSHRVFVLLEQVS